MKENNEKILVIGNGFDLYHGKETKYEHFLSFLKELNTDKSIVNSNFDLNNYSFEKSSLLKLLINQYNHGEKYNYWIDLETTLKRFVLSIISFIDEENDNDRGGRRINEYNFSKIKSPEKRRLIENMSSFFDCIGTDYYRLKSEYIDFWGKIDKQKILKKIDKELDDVSGYLHYYLSEYEPSRRSKAINRMGVINVINPAKVISFNYTNTYHEIYDFPEEKIKYIHGNLKKNNIVLGYDDLDGNLEDIMFKKYYKRLINKTDTVGSFYYEDGYGGTVSPDVYIFGHSLDKSDEDIINYLFSIKNIMYIYYLDESDRANKVINLIRIIGKDKIISQIESKNVVFRSIKEFLK